MDRFIRFFIILFFGLAAGCVSFPSKYHHFCPCIPHTFRVATYNIFWQNRTCSPTTEASAVNMITTINADVLVLQESTPFWQTCFNKHFRKKYPYQLFHDCKPQDHEDGIGILSKHPIIYYHVIPAVYGWFPAAVYCIKTPHGVLQVLNVHLNPPVLRDNSIGFMGYALFTTPKIRETEIRDFIRYLNPNLPTIIAGDFNESDNGRAVHYLKSHAYEDALSTINPAIMTWYWRYGLITLFGRYDHIMYSCQLKPIHSQVLQEGKSDHFPVVLDFYRPGKI